MLAKRFFFACAGLLCLVLVYHSGSQGAAAQGTGAPEIAILTGAVADGGTIPLPHYLDASEAPESECHWIASVHTASASIMGGVWCYTTGRVVSVGAGGNCPCPPAVADYMIIATRSNASTSTAGMTWGGVKARYRTEGKARRGCAPFLGQR